MSTPSFIDELSHIQSRVRDGEKWEHYNEYLGWITHENADREDSVKSLNDHVEQGYQVRLRPCTCAVEEER